MNNLDELRQTVSAYLSKDLSDYTFGGIDLVTTAIDEARIWAEKRHDFSAAYDRVQDTLSLGIQKAFPLGVKKLRYCFLGSQNVNGTNNQSAGPIPIISADMAWRKSEYYAPYPYNYEVEQPNRRRELCLVVDGFKYSLYPQPYGLGTPVDFNIDLDVVLWFPTYIGQPGTYVDWFIRYGSEFLRLKAIRDLTFRQLSVDPTNGTQLGISAKAVEEAFMDLLKFDTNLTENTYSVLLD